MSKENEATLAHPVPRPEGEGLLLGRQRARQVAMLHQHALGRPVVPEV